MDNNVITQVNVDVDKLVSKLMASNKNNAKLAVWVTVLIASNYAMAYLYSGQKKRVQTLLKQLEAMKGEPEM